MNRFNFFELIIVLLFFIKKQLHKSDSLIIIGQAYFLCGQIFLCTVIIPLIIKGFSPGEFLKQLIRNHYGLIAENPPQQVDNTLKYNIF